MLEGPAAAHLAGDAAWVLRGVTSNERYVTRGEHSDLAARQESLGRAGATRAVLIPIKKSAEWCELAQDERRRIVRGELASRRSAWSTCPSSRAACTTGATSASRSTSLTWFEYAPEHAAAFELLVQRLRATEEWAYPARR